jgi:hypothetical protein
MAVRVAAATHALRRRTGYAEHEPGRRAHLARGLQLARSSLTTEQFDKQWMAGSRTDYPHLFEELFP